MQLSGALAGRSEYAVLSTNNGQAASGLAASQFGTEQTEFTHEPVLQSAPIRQAEPVAHGAQLPPQLKSVSSPLQARSLQAGGWQA
jgi:hypothetical protein